MIHGIGTDLVAVARMQGLVQRHGARFAARILNEAELRDLADAPDPARFLAKRFAAKEAAAKAMGTGFRDGLSLRHIGINHDSLGKPELSFSGRARDLIAEMAISASHLSISDETDYACAFVVMER